MKKSATGITGFDDMTAGGLPSGRTTLIEGGAGAGKTLFALQTIAHGARQLEEPGIFVAFEESPERIAANVRDFGWDLPGVVGDSLFFLDARPDPDLIRTGDFDIAGMLAALEAQVEAMAPKRIVFDAIDNVLDLIGDARAMRREVHRLQKWLEKHDLTALITAKVQDGSSNVSNVPHLGFLQFMVDCSIRLEHDMVDGVSQRSLWIRKYRGSAFEESVTPFVVGDGGVEVAFSQGRGIPGELATSDRLPTGVDELDDMLNGGYFRGASILLTGAPGTAKTTLCGAFAESACERGEKTLFVSFDSRADEIVRNLESVSIRLGRFIESGVLRMASMRALGGSAETHLMRIKALARSQGAQCLVTDPLSALSKTGNRDTAPGVAERLVDWAKAEGMTVVCTSLVAEGAEPTGGTPLQISTIADTWIHLNYVINAGERNRGLSIIKSRGTSHSNQVRELVLSDTGVTMTDVYTENGEVLMGTLRWARERAEILANREREAEGVRRSEQLQIEAVELETRITALSSQLEAKRREKADLIERQAENAEASAATRMQLQLRRTDQRRVLDGDDRDVS